MFKKIILFVIFSLFLFQANATEVEILKVYDGDTVLAKIKDNVFKIRLIDIDCFEGAKSQRAKYQADLYNMSEKNVVKGGNIAGKTLKNLLNNKKANFEFMGIDKYNRALGVLYVNGENINKKMLNSQYCKPYKRFK